MGLKHGGTVTGSLSPVSFLSLFLAKLLLNGCMFVYFHISICTVYINAWNCPLLLIFSSISSRVMIPWISVLLSVHEFKVATLLIFLLNLLSFFILPKLSCKNVWCTASKSKWKLLWFCYNCCVVYWATCCQIFKFITTYQSGTPIVCYLAVI